jgi:DNA-binding NtrC family response regulator
MRKIQPLTMSIYSDNRLLSEKIKSAMGKKGSSVFLKSEDDLLRLPGDIRGNIVLVELEKEFEKKLARLSELKKQRPTTLIIGLTGSKFYPQALSALNNGLDYLLTKPLKYQLLPYLLSRARIF